MKDMKEDREKKEKNEIDEKNTLTIEKDNKT